MCGKHTVLYNKSFLTSDMLDAVWIKNLNKLEVKLQKNA